MWRFITISLMAIGAAVFAQAVTFDTLKDILQPLIVALSIMAAALLVRLNRGMPTLDWKGLDAEERKVLTSKIVELSHEYMGVLLLQSVTLAYLLALVVLNAQVLSANAQKGLLAITGALLLWCVARMAYIVWRDCDIMALQKKLIDESADREAVENASKEALSKVAAIKASQLRAGSRIEVSDWPDESKGN